MFNWRIYAQILCFFWNNSNDITQSKKCHISLTFKNFILTLLTFVQLTHLCTNFVLVFRFNRWIVRSLLILKISKWKSLPHFWQILTPAIRAHLEGGPELKRKGGSITIRFQSPILTNMENLLENASYLTNQSARADIYHFFKNKNH